MELSKIKELAERREVNLDSATLGLISEILTIVRKGYKDTLYPIVSAARDTVDISSQIDLLDTFDAILSIIGTDNMGVIHDTLLHKPNETEYLLSIPSNMVSKQQVLVWARQLKSASNRRPLEVMRAELVKLHLSMMDRWANENAVSDDKFIPEWQVQSWAGRLADAIHFLHDFNEEKEYAEFKVSEITQNLDAISSVLTDMVANTNVNSEVESDPYEGLTDEDIEWVNNQNTYTEEDEIALAKEIKKRKKRNDKVFNRPNEGHIGMENGLTDVTVDKPYSIDFTTLMYWLSYLDSVECTLLEHDTRKNATDTTNMTFGCLRTLRHSIQDLQFKIHNAAVKLKESSRIGWAKELVYTNEQSEKAKKHNTKPHHPVNRPSHYTSHPSGIECIEITRHMGFNLGNAIKYLWRNGLKNNTPAVQDLKKAVWYIQDEIKKLEVK